MVRESRLLWADYLRFIATLGVIMIHVSADILTQFGSISNLNWNIGNLFDSSARFSVPIFIMLTGALVLPKEYSINEFLKKMMFRIVIPFLFWSFVYILINYSNRMLGDTSYTVSEQINWFMNQIINGSSFHLWYVYMIIGIYLFIPILGKWIRNSNKKEIIYFLVIWAITIFLDQILFSKSKPRLHLTYFSGFIGYLVLGYYIAFNFKMKNGNIISMILIISSLLITCLGTYVFSHLRNQFFSKFYDYLMPNIILLSACIFYFFRHQIYYNKPRKVFSIVNRYSYGIYLAHILILYLLSKIGISYNLINPLIGIPATTILCLVLSTLLLFLLSKIPYGKYLVG